MKAADNQIDQLEPLFGRQISEIFMQKAIAFRMMHPMGRAHITLHLRHSPGIDTRVLREGEFISNTITALGTVEKGWYHNDDAAHEQPWLPNGLLPHVITWTREGYTAAGEGYPGPGKMGRTSRPVRADA